MGEGRRRSCCVSCDALRTLLGGNIFMQYSYMCVCIANREFMVSFVKSTQ